MTFPKFQTISFLKINMNLKWKGKTDLHEIFDWVNMP